MTKRVLITGIGGSIGCHILAHVMHNTDWNVVGIDSFRHKGLSDRVVEMLREHDDWRLRLFMHTHDLSAPISAQLFSRIGHVDYIINAAALSDVEASLATPEPFIVQNVQIATTMLEYARLVKPEAFVQISTDEVYGPCDPSTPGHPEWSAILPSNPYAASKACQEAIAIAYWRSYRVPVVIVNTMNNFGEMQQPAKFPAMVQKLVSRGEVVKIHGRPGEIGSRFYLHSRNFADALLYILRLDAPYQHRDGHIDRPDRYNIVGDLRVDNLQLARTIAQLMGKTLKYEMVDFHSERPGHDRHYGLDGAKLAALGWKSPREFQESLVSVLNWTAQHPEWLE
jgi:dTDP-glucose 4,6-dehydratase